MKSPFLSSCPFAVTAVFASFVSLNVLADHGPGTSGGGASTVSGETLKPGKFSIEFREDFTEFESLSKDQIENKATNAGSIDLIDRSFLHSISLSYGVIENFQVGLSLGYYDAVRAREAEFDPATGDVETATFNPDGLTDLWLSGKYRFYRGPQGNLAVFGGVKFPTGKSSVINSAAEEVEPSATAGSGSYDGMLGLAYSRYITSRITFDASAQYTLRTEHRDFKLGDRIDGGVALNYRFTKDIQKYPQVSAFTEANIRYLYRSEEGGVADPNTGGTVLFLSPGVRLGFNRNFSFTLSAPIPVMQDLNGEQLKTAFKITGALTLSF